MRIVLSTTFGLASLFTAAAAESPPTFDVASVRTSTAQVPSGLTTNPGRLAATAASLSDLIQQASGVSNLRISGAPTNLGRFDIVGKVEGSYTRSELLRMLQALLAERFKLALHREMKELSVGALVAAKNGSSLHPTVKEGDPSIALQPGPSAKPGSVLIAGKNVTLPFVADYLSDHLRRIVLDRTELVGSFDFDVELIVDRDDFSNTSVSERDNMTHLFTDLVTKLGLKLESQKTLVEILVVDHAEKPTDN